MAITVKQVTVEAIRPIRAQVLRPGLPLSASHYPGDEDPRTGAYAAFDNDTLVGQVPQCRKCALGIQR